MDSFSKKKITVKMQDYEIIFINNFVRFLSIPITLVTIMYFILAQNIRWLGIISFIIIAIVSLTLFKTYFKKCAYKIEFEEGTNFNFQFFIDNRKESYTINEMQKISIKSDTYFYTKKGKKITWKKNEKNNIIFEHMKKMVEAKNRGRIK
jgi:preprotein translocase subunit SecF